MPDQRAVIACLDANPIISLLLGEPADQAQAVHELVEAVAARGERLWIFPTTVAEVAMTLDRAYKVARVDIAEELLGFLDHRGVHVERPDIVRAALVSFGSHNVPFYDALLAVEMVSTGCTEVYTWDRHFDRISGIRRRVP